MSRGRRRSQGTQVPPSRTAGACQAADCSKGARMGDWPQLGGGRRVHEADFFTQGPVPPACLTLRKGKGAPSVPMAAALSLHLPRRPLLPAFLSSQTCQDCPVPQGESLPQALRRNTSWPVNCNTGSNPVSITDRLSGDQGLGGQDSAPQNAESGTGRRQRRKCLQSPVSLFVKRR